MEAIILGNPYSDIQGNTTPITVPSTETSPAIILQSSTTDAIIISNSGDSSWKKASQYIITPSDDTVSVVIGTTSILGSEKFRVSGISNFDTIIFGGESTYISSIKNEADLVSNDTHAIPTQYSVKTYIETWVTSTDKTQWNLAYTNTHTHSNKALLDTYTQSNSDLASAVNNTHTHSNKALLDSLTTVENPNLFLNGEGQYIQAVIPTDFSDFSAVSTITESDITDWQVAYTNTHTHDNKLLLDTYTNTNSDIGTAITNSHTHTNKSLLDSIVSDGTGDYFLADDGTYKYLGPGGGVGATGTIVFNDSGVFSYDNSFTYDNVNYILGVPTILSPSILLNDGVTYTSKIYTLDDGDMYFNTTATGEVALSTIIAGATNFWDSETYGINYDGIVGINSPTTTPAELNVNGSIYASGNITATKFSSSIYRYSNNNVLIGPAAGDAEGTSNKLYIHNSSSSSPLIYGDFTNYILRLNADTYITAGKSIRFGTTNTISIYNDGSDNLMLKDVNANSGVAVSLSSLIDGSINALVSDFTDYSGVTAISSSDITTWDTASILTIAGAGNMYLADDGTYKYIPVSPITDNIFKWDTINVYYRPYADKTEAGGGSSSGKIYNGTDTPTATTRLNYDGYLHATKLFAGESEIVYHDPVTLGTTNGLSLSTQQLSLGLASTSSTGALSSTDWNTFNDKQDALGYIAEDTSNKLSAWQIISDDIHYPSEKLVKDSLDAKQSLYIDLYANDVFGSTDFDTFTGIGTYTVNGTYTNDPNIGVTISGYLIVSEQHYLTSTILVQEYVHTLITDLDVVGKQWHRVKNSTTWSSWVTSQCPLGNILGIVKGNGDNTYEAAVAGTDYESPISKGNLSETVSSVLTITGGVSSVIGTGTTIQVTQASTTNSGYLSSTDWNTFNGKQSSISGIENNMLTFNSSGIPVDSGFPIWMFL